LDCLDKPSFLADTLDIRTETQDYYWKLLKETNYTSWIPRVQFEVIYAGSTRLRYKAEYFLQED
jgi:hypothetical protein